MLVRSEVLVPEEDNAEFGERPTDLVKLILGYFQAKVHAMNLCT
jgi:hypothetical protein